MALSKEKRRKLAMMIVEDLNRVGQEHRKRLHEHEVSEDESKHLFSLALTLASKKLWNHPLPCLD